MPNFLSLVHFLLVGDHPKLGENYPWVGGVMVGDHPLQLSPGVSFVSKV